MSKIRAKHNKLINRLLPKVGDVQPTNNITCPDGGMQVTSELGGNQCQSEVYCTKYIVSDTGCGQGGQVQVEYGDVDNGRVYCKCGGVTTNVGGVKWNQCKCPSDKPTYKDGQCVALECDPGYIKNKDGTACVESCIGKDGNFCGVGTCNQTTGICTCGSLAHYDDNQRCICNSGLIQPTGTYICHKSCDDTHQCSVGTCKNGYCNCTGGSISDVSTGGCLCTGQGKIWRSDLQKCYCTVGHAPHPITGVCTQSCSATNPCSAGTCTNSPDKSYQYCECTGGTGYDAKQMKCVCAPGYVWNGSLCVQA